MSSTRQATSLTGLLTIVVLLPAVPARSLPSGPTCSACDEVAGTGVPLLPAQLPLSSASSPAPGTARHAVIVGFSPFAQTVVRRAIDRAVQKLHQPGCSDVYSDFDLPHGGTPRDVLERIGLAPQELLGSMIFVDGSRDKACRVGPAVLRIETGTYVIRVCPQFLHLQLQDPGLSASLIIHESLHALGLGEDPPSSRAITRQVERRCWRAATDGPGSQSPTARPACTACHEGIRRVIPLLPEPPPRVVVLDHWQPSTRQLRTEGVEVFVVPGDQTV